MGEIDAMSRREKHPDLSLVCPSLLPSLLIPLDITPISSLFRLCDPAAIPLSHADFSRTYVSVLHSLQSILSSDPFLASVP